MDESLVRILVAEHLAVPRETVTDSARFRYDLGADSLDMIELSMMLENRFGVAIGDDEAEQCVTFGDALHLLRLKSPGVC
jgi:acyl carrier protein